MIMEARKPPDLLRGELVTSQRMGQGYKFWTAAESLRAGNVDVQGQEKINVSAQGKRVSRCFLHFFFLYSSPLLT